MAAITAVNPAFKKSNSNSIQAKAEVLVHTAATWKAGCFLRLANDGFLYLGTSGAAVGVGDDAVTHQALSDLSTSKGVSTGREYVGVVKPTDVYEISELDTTIAEAARGQHCGMNVSTEQICTADISDTTNPIFYIVAPNWREREFQDASDDTLARMLVSVLSTAVNATPTN